MPRGVPITNDWHAAGAEGRTTTMGTPFHPGELEVQARAGVSGMAARIGNGIHPTIPAAARDFLADQPFAVVGSVAVDGRVWASLLTGAPGFMRAWDERTVRLDAAPAPGDPLADNLRANPEVGMLVIEPASRRRMRLNGTASVRPDGGLQVSTRQVYANCPKYIQARAVAGAAGAGEPSPRTAGARRGAALTADQRAWIAGADTFFIASAHPKGGADASHRGGNPGFVRVAGPRRLVFPDYAGNSMFNTLGNITANPRAGLLFLDFEQGRTLQVSGRARVIWDARHAADVAGAERLVEVDVEETIERADSRPLHWRFIDYSRFNPA